MTISHVAERRRRILTRALPLVLIASVSFFLGVSAVGDSELGSAAERFASAWEERDFEAMFSELAPSSSNPADAAELAALYEETERTSTLTSLSLGPAGEQRDGADGSEIVPFTATVETYAFGTLEGPIEIEVTETGVLWDTHLLFPGLAPGESLERNTRVGDRAPILAANGVALAKGPSTSRVSPLGAAATNVTGALGMPSSPRRSELDALGFPTGVLAGTSGLEQAFDSRLAGRPGGTLVAIDGDGAERILAESEPVDGEPVYTTIDPELQEAAVLALGSLFGGVAVLDAKTGEIRALAGVAFSAPQPPGSTYKIVTTVGALEEKAVSLDEEFPVVSSALVGGREIENAGGELCGGTFVEAFAHSCNTVFAPLGAEIGAEKLLDVSERFGMNQPPTLFQEDALAVIDPPASTIPDPIGSELDVGVSAIGQGQVLATPLQLASFAQTIAADGLRSPTALVRGELAPEAEPVTVTDEEIAETVTGLMEAVVTSGTGINAAIPGVRVAGKTGTAELGPDPDAPPAAPGETPKQEVDAWFTAFAPAEKPQLAVAVMIVDATADGGTVAAPIARAVLEAGLE